MKTPRVELEATFYAVYYGFELIGIFSAYQLRENFTDEELALFWGYPVSE